MDQQLQQRTLWRELVCDDVCTDVHVKQDLPMHEVVAVVELGVDEGTGHRLIVFERSIAGMQFIQFGWVGQDKCFLLSCAVHGFELPVSRLEKKPILWVIEGNLHSLNTS